VVASVNDEDTEVKAGDAEKGVVGMDLEVEGGNGEDGNGDVIVDEDAVVLNLGRKVLQWATMTKKNTSLPQTLSSSFSQTILHFKVLPHHPIGSSYNELHSTMKK